MPASPSPHKGRCWLEKTKFDIIADRLFRDTVNDDHTNILDLMEIMYAYFDLSEMRFSSKYKSKFGWKLTDGNTTVKRIRVKNDHYSNMKWILAEMEPMDEGVYCWRVQVNNPHKGWMSIGVAQPIPEEMNRRPFGGPSVWAIGLSNTWYPSSAAAGADSISGINWTQSFRMKFVELDVKVTLDGDDSELRICAVDDNEERRETILRNKPSTFTEGWLPYWNWYVFPFILFPHE